MTEPRKFIDRNERACISVNSPVREMRPVQSHGLLQGQSGTRTQAFCLLVQGFSWLRYSPRHLWVVPIQVSLCRPGVFSLYSHLSACTSSPSGSLRLLHPAQSLCHQPPWQGHFCPMTNGLLSLPSPLEASDTQNARFSQTGAESAYSLPDKSEGL